MKLVKIGKEEKPENGNGNGNGNGKMLYDAYHLPPVKKRALLSRKLIVIFYAVTKDKNGNILNLEYQGEGKTNYGEQIITWNQLDYKINYELVVAKKKHWEYWTDVLDVKGGLSPKCYPEMAKTIDGKVHPKQARQYFDTLKENTFTNPTGLSKTLLMVLIIGLVAMAGGLIFIVMQWSDASSQLAHDHPLLQQYMQAYPPPVAKPSAGSTSGNSNSGAIIVHH